MTTMMAERNVMGMGMTGPAAATPAGMNMMMVPRCKMTLEKCAGGMKITCACDDKVSAGMLQNLCTMMAGGMCSLLHDDERDDGLLLQPDDGHVQVRDDRQGRLHDLHQRRQGLLRDDPGLLRLLRSHDEGRLHLLHDDERHAGLLRLLTSRFELNFGARGCAVARSGWRSRVTLGRGPLRPGHRFAMIARVEVAPPVSSRRPWIAQRTPARPRRSERVSPAPRNGARARSAVTASPAPPIRTRP